MIDLHAHILPGLDDGADSLEEALAMARRAVADGIRSVVATPHVITGLYPNKKETILTAVEQFQVFLSDNEIPLSILPGAEYRLEPDLPKRLARGELLTVNEGGRYILLELPTAIIPDFTSQVIYELLLQGITPIIVHPERNAGFIRNPLLLHDLVSRGALVQVTAGSLTNLFGSEAAAAARTFLEYGCVHFIASDAHSSDERAPAISAAVREAARMVGKGQAQGLVTNNPGQVVQGKGIETNGLKEIRPARLGFIKRIFPW